MKAELLILLVQAVIVYFMVLGAHALRGRAGLAFFYALLGGLTAVMSWVTDAGVKVAVGGVTFYAGSTVFYTSLLLGVFVVYVFDGPRATRVAISTVAAVSALTPVAAWALNLQMQYAGLDPALSRIPVPSLRINTASVLTTIVDLFFLGMAWEFLGNAKLRIPLWLRAYLTMLGVLLLDMLLFATAAFGGTPAYLDIMQGTLVARLCISVLAFPFLAGYLNWQNSRPGVMIEARPVLAIMRENTAIREELGVAQREIARRIQAEREKEELIAQLQKSMSEIKTLRGILPTCSSCKKIRDEEGKWHGIEHYIHEHSEAEFTHGICEECAQTLYGKYLKPKS